MTKQEAIKKAKEMIYGLTEYKWKDLTKEALMEERLTGITEFIFFAYSVNAKEFAELNDYKDERFAYWKNNR